MGELNGVKAAQSERSNFVKESKDQEEPRAKVVSNIGAVLKLTAKKRKPTSMPFNLPGDEVDAASRAPVQVDHQHHESDYLESENFKSVVDHDQ